MDGPAIPIVTWVVVSLALAVFCAFCAVRPDKIVAFARTRHLKAGKFTRKLFVTNLVMRSWYPQLVRVIGVCGFPIVLIWMVFGVRVMNAKFHQ